MTFFRHNYCNNVKIFLNMLKIERYSQISYFCDILSTGTFLSHTYSFTSFWYVKLNHFSYSPPKFLYLRPIYILQFTCYSLYSALDISRSGWATRNTGVSLRSVYTEIVETCKNEMFPGLQQNPDCYKNVKGNIVYSITTSHLYCKRTNKRILMFFRPCIIV